MEKNTILAVVLSTLVLVAFYVIQGVLYPPQSPDVVQNQPPPVTAVMTDNEQIRETPPPPTVETTQVPVQPSAPVTSAASEPVDAGPQAVQHITIRTESITAVLTSAGGNMISWKLNDHFDKSENVNMILSGTNEAQAFSIAFGGLDAQPVTSFFHVNRLTDHIVEFYRDFSIPAASSSANAGGVFRLTKRYEFKPRDYMFELTVTLDGGFSVPGFNFSGNAYTLSFGPQIGPRFEKLDHYDYRQYAAFTNGKSKNAKVNDMINTNPAWAAISGKYFSIIAIPYIAPPYSINFTERSEPGIVSASRLNIIRPAVNTSKVSDTYRFYMGPKSQDALAIYNTGRNDFNLIDPNLIEAASSRGILAPLEKILKWFLLLFYKVVPNYGMAIIMLTLFIKIIFFPLTKKGSEATLRMQALGPKIKELQEKYKSNPQKLNTEMAAFYKQEGYNPISGCLPMLLQIPIFIAMYGLFNNHFDLRGATFIPGWIPDLSVPEAIWNFPGSFRMPLLGWSALRLLPFIYVGSQLLYGKVTQMPGQQTNAQMKMMIYVMPIVFFFILYDVPSGLLIYWIFSNILTMVQQVIINKYVMAKRAQEPPPPPPVIAPAKKKKKS